MTTVLEAILAPTVTDVIKFASGVTATAGTVLTVWIRCREHRAIVNARPPKKADYDLAIETFGNDPLLRTAFEDIRKAAVIKKTLGVTVRPEEIGALARFYKSGRVSATQLGHAWGYHRFGKNRSGAIVRLYFRVRGDDRVNLWIANIYSGIVMLMFIASMVLNVLSGFSMVFPLIAIMLFLVMILTLVYMSDSLNSAARLESRSLFLSTKYKVRARQFRRRFAIAKYRDSVPVVV